MNSKKNEYVYAISGWQNGNCEAISGLTLPFLEKMWLLRVVNKWNIFAKTALSVVT